MLPSSLAQIVLRKALNPIQLDVTGKGLRRAMSVQSCQQTQTFKGAVRRALIPVSALETDGGFLCESGATWQHPGTAGSS